MLLCVIIFFILWCYVYSTNPPLSLSPRAGSVEEPQVQRVHRSCESEHANFCQNGGKCIYPQDSEKPFCM